MTGSVWAGSASGILTSKIIREIALSDMVTALVAANGVGYFRVYAPFRVTALYSSVFVVSSGGLPTIDINVNSVSVLTTKLTIDVNEKNSADATTPYVWTGSPAPAFRDFSIGEEVSFDIDVAGTGTKGLVLYMLGFDL